MRLGIDDLAIDVDVGDARAVPDARRRELLLREPDRLDDLLRVVGPARTAGAVGVRRRQQDVGRRNLQFGFDLPAHRLPERVRDAARINRDQCRARPRRFR